MSTFSLKETYFSNSDYDPDKYAQKHKNLKNILSALEISVLFQILFQQGNEYCLTADARDFVLYIDESFSSAIGKALRLNNLPKILENKAKLFEILKKFDLAINPFPKAFKTWFHNTKYYYYILEEDILAYKKEINDISFTDYFFIKRDEYYYLSNTQLHDLFQDMQINQAAFKKEGKIFIRELGEFAYKKLNENALNFEQLYNKHTLKDLEEIPNIFQIFYEDILSKNTDYQRILSEILRLENNSTSKLNDIKKLENLKKKLYKIENDTFQKYECNTETKRLFHKFIQQGKIERIPFTSEEGFISMYGIESYKTLKQEILCNSSYEYIKE